MQFLKKPLPIAIAFIMGLIMFIREYVPTKFAEEVYSWFTRWTIIIVGFAAILAIVSLVHYHTNKVRRRVPGYGYSVVALVAFWVMLIVAFIWGVVAPSGGGYMPPAVWLYRYMFLPAQATMFATLAFFIASAGFRAFRARTPEATALLIAGLIVMIGRVPAGDELVNLFARLFGGNELGATISVFSDWIMNNPNMAGYRGIFLGLALAQIAISVRIIFGIERTYMGGGE